jgi:4,5-DOPA dioxygenase extradiol
MLPALYVSHGAPTLPLDDVPARDFLAGLGTRLPRPKAIVCVSAHWDTEAPALNAVAVNDTIHDFTGFPESLYRLRYPAPGAPDLAQRVQALLGPTATLDTARGLDHGAWVPLLLMYPKADIPVVQLSVQSNRSAADHIALGRALAPLREEDVLIVGSGGFVHNLRRLDRGGHNGPEPAWSARFSDWVHGALTERRDDDLANYRRLAPDAAMAQPSEEHFFPLLVAYGAGQGAVSRLHRSATFGALRMDAYAFA